MADNTQLNAPDIPGGDKIATDALSTVNGAAAEADLKVQRVKVGFGVDGDLNDVNSGAPLPVTDAALAAKDFATQTTLAAVLAKLSADPATQTTLAAVLAKLSSDPATQTTLAAILAKLIAAPSTEAKQDTANTSLASIDSKLTNPLPVSGTVNANIAGVVEVTNDAGNPLPVNGTVSVGNFPATQPVSGPLTDTQLRATPVPVSNSNIDVALSTRTKPSDQQHTIIDSITAGTNYIGYINPDLSPSAVSITVAGNGNVFAIAGMAFVGMNITGSASNFIFKAQISTDGGTTWSDTYMFIAGGTQSQTASLNGQYGIVTIPGTSHVRVVLNSITAGTFTYQYRATMNGAAVNLSVSTPGFNIPPSATMVGGVDSNGKLQVFSTTTGGIINVNAATLPLPSNAAKETGGNLDTLVAKDFATESTLQAIRRLNENPARYENENMSGLYGGYSGQR